MARSPKPITVIILSYNRPLYLWTCLDSLYRFTTYPARFVLVDNHSDDPGVRQVVKGFERRGMFDAVQWHDSNSPKRVAEAIAEFRSAPGKYLVVIEGDVAVFDTKPCWLSTMYHAMEADPALGILGSYIDTRDFVDPERARQIAPELDPCTRDELIKTHSLERTLSYHPPHQLVIEPFNPPGRLGMIRKDIIDIIPFTSDGRLYPLAKAAGIKFGISTEVRHRHLSLLNLFDYPDYDVQARDRFVQANDVATPIGTNAAARPVRRQPGAGR